MIKRMIAVFVMLFIIIVFPQTASAASGEGEENNDSIWLPQNIADVMSVNNDLVGWLTIEGTEIDYPVMSDIFNPLEYLSKDINLDYSFLGTPFLNVKNDPLDPNQNLVIGARDTHGRSLFSDIRNYSKPGYLEEHPVVVFDSLYSYEEYEIVYVIKSRTIVLDRYDTFRYYEETEFPDEESFERFIRGIEKLAICSSGKEIEYGDQMLTLTVRSKYSVGSDIAIVAVKI